MNKEIEEKLNLINEELKDLKLHLVPKEEVEGVVCSNVTNEDIPFILEQIPDMNKIVTAHIGLGIAAPQVGIKKKFYLAHINGEYELFCNAKYFLGSGSRNSHLEGCLSYPLTEHAQVKRWKEVIVHYDMIVNNTLVHMKKKFKGMEAFEHQHEIDHCGNGDGKPSLTVYMKR